MPYISQNIKHLRESLGMSQTEFGKLFDLTRDKIASYESKVTPSVETLIAIGDYFHKSLDTLVGSNLAEGGSLEVNDPQEAYLHKSNEGVPLVSPEAIAGLGNSIFKIEEKDVQGRYIIPEFEKIDFLIRVKGPSMEPKYSSGDIVACRVLKERSFIQWNRVHVLATQEQGILIKRVKKGSNNNSITAVSDNPDFDPFEVPWKDINGLALVVGSIRLD